MAAPPDLVARIGLLLRAVSAHEPDGATTTQISDTSGLARPTTHRLLTSLAGQGLVQRVSETGWWQLGPELHFLGRSAAARYDVTHLAHPVVRKLAIDTGESAFYSVRRGDESICLIREDGAFPLRSHVLDLGSRFPLGVASAGLVILAFLSVAERDDYLHRADLTAEFGSEHSAEKLRHRLDTTRAAGFATNPGLIVEGSWGMAAAVFDPDDVPVGALSLTGVADRFSEGRRPELGALLLTGAHVLSTRLAQRHQPS